MIDNFDCKINKELSRPIPPAYQRFHRRWSNAALVANGLLSVQFTYVWYFSQSNVGIIYSLLVANVTLARHVDRKIKIIAFSS